MRTVLALLLLFVLSSVAYSDDVMDLEIDHILNAVVESDCVFIRNGKEHGPEAAKDHLTLKRDRGKRYYSNADEFIEKMASSSSWSGKPYHIRCGDKEQQLAGDWFNAVLAEYRNTN